MTASYYQVHKRLRRERGRAVDYPCAACGTNEGRRERSYQYTAGPDEITEEGGRFHGCLYAEDVWEHYAPLCVPCHRALDLDRDPRILETLRATGARNGAALKGTTKTAEHVARMWASRKQKLEDDPEAAVEYSERYAQTMRTTNSKRYRCAECEYENNAGNLGHHNRKTGHTGRVPANAS